MVVMRAAIRTLLTLLLSCGFETWTTQMHRAFHSIRFIEAKRLNVFTLWYDESDVNRFGFQSIYLLSQNILIKMGYLYCCIVFVDRQLAKLFMIIGLLFGVRRSRFVLFLFELCNGRIIKGVMWMGIGNRWRLLGTMFWLCCCRCGEQEIYIWVIHRNKWMKQMIVYGFVIMMLIAMIGAMLIL